MQSPDERHVKQAAEQLPSSPPEIAGRLLHQCILPACTHGDYGAATALHRWALNANPASARAALSNNNVPPLLLQVAMQHSPKLVRSNSSCCTIYFPGFVRARLLRRAAQLAPAGGAPPAEAPGGESGKWEFEHCIRRSLDILGSQDPSLKLFLLQRLDGGDSVRPNALEAVFDAAGRWPAEDAVHVVAPAGTRPLTRMLESVSIPSRCSALQARARRLPPRCRPAARPC